MSGTLGEPKAVLFTLLMPVESGQLLASSIGLGIGVMPLRHVWCITCNYNLFAPLVSRGGLVHLEDNGFFRPGCGLIPSRGGATVRPGGGGDGVLCGSHNVGVLTLLNTTSNNGKIR